MFGLRTSWKVDGRSPKGTYREGSGRQGRTSTTSFGRTDVDGSLKEGTWSWSRAFVILLLVRLMCEIQSPVPSEHLISTAPFRLPFFVNKHIPFAHYQVVWYVHQKYVGDCISGFSDVCEPCRIACATELVARRLECCGLDQSNRILSWANRKMDKPSEGRLS